MIESSKYHRKNYPRKCFWTQERETRIKFNPGLSANRPSNSWALLQIFVCSIWEISLWISQFQFYFSNDTLYHKWHFLNCCPLGKNYNKLFHWPNPMEKDIKFLLCKCTFCAKQLKTTFGWLSFQNITLFKNNTFLTRDTKHGNTVTNSRYEW